MLCRFIVGKLCEGLEVDSLPDDMLSNLSLSSFSSYIKNLKLLYMHKKSILSIGQDNNYHHQNALHALYAYNALIKCCNPV